MFSCVLQDRIAFVLGQSVEWGVDWVLNGQWNDSNMPLGVLDVGHEFSCV